MNALQAPDGQHSELCYKKISDDTEMIVSYVLKDKQATKGAKNWFELHSSCYWND